MRRVGDTVTGWSLRTRTFVTVVLAVSAVVAVTGATLSVRADREASQTASSEQDGRAFAVQVVPTLLSYDFDSAEAHFADVLDDLGGDFRSQFEEVGKTVIVPSALERQVVTNAEVLESAVVRAGPDDAELLLFLNQSTTSAESPETKLDGSRVRVHVERSGDRWLITELVPV